MAKSSLFESSISKMPWDKVALAANKIVKQKHKRMSHLGPKLVREAISETLFAHAKLSAHAKSITNLPSEVRDYEDPKIGSGVMMKLKGGKFKIRIRISPRLFNNKDSYWALMVAQYGRGPVRPKKGKLLAMAVSSPYGLKKLVPHKSKPGKYVVFSTESKAVAPYYKWIDRSKILAVKKLINLAKG